MIQYLLQYEVGICMQNMNLHRKKNILLDHAQLTSHHTERHTIQRPKFTPQFPKRDRPTPAGRRSLSQPTPIPPAHAPPPLPLRRRSPALTHPAPPSAMVSVQGNADLAGPRCSSAGTDCFRGRRHRLRDHVPPVLTVGRGRWRWRTYFTVSA
jgi:hypothetical protein